MGSASHRERPTARSGFSVVEMTVALFFVGVVGVTVLPNLATLGGKARLDAAARQLKGGFEQARSQAIRQRAVHVLQLGDHGFNIFRDLNHNGLRDAGEGWLWASETRLPPGLSFRSPVVPARGEPGSLARTGCRCLGFGPDGALAMASAGGAGHYVDLGDGEEYRRIRVPDVGEPRVQRWHPGRKQWE